MRMLVFPFSNNRVKLPSVQKEEVEPFVQELAWLIDRLVDRELPHHEDWAGLKTTVMGTLEMPDLLGVAIGLGLWQGGDEGLAGATAVGRLSAHRDRRQTPD
jgi:hypothetical protein